MVDDVGLTRGRDRADELAADEERDRATVRAQERVVDIRALLEGRAGLLVATAHEQRGLAEALGDRGLAREPRVVAGAGCAELRLEDDVAA